MIKIGITGQSGFIGTHLFNTLGFYPDKFTRIPFEDNYFQSEDKLKTFVKECDAIVHLAAMNRHSDPQVIYQTNIGLVTQLILACEATDSLPHILFSSSTQEERDNLYGRSKKEGRELFEKWADKNNAKFTGLIITNVYGPFGNPFYNSVIATFCYQLTHNEPPKIEIDGEIKLIYVGELVQHFIDNIIGHPVTQGLNTVLHSRKIGTSCETITVQPTAEIKVSALLRKLTSIKENYYEKGIIPNLSNPFDLNLFNTFLCYIDHATFFPFKLNLNSDQRGSFVEIAKLNCGGQISFSTTVPGITRGNHFHTRKTERFAVVKGKARIDIRRIGTDKVISFELEGKQPAFVDMPIWFTHNITNIGEEDLYTIFWINEHYEANDSNTWFEEV